MISAAFIRKMETTAIKRARPMACTVAFCSHLQTCRAARRPGVHRRHAGCFPASLRRRNGQTALEIAAACGRECHSDDLPAELQWEAIPGDCCRRSPETHGGKAWRHARSVYAPLNSERTIHSL